MKEQVLPLHQPNFNIPIDNITLSERATLTEWQPPVKVPKDYFWWEVRGSEIYISMPKLGHFHVKGGIQIDYSLINNADPIAMQAFISRVLFSSIIHQRHEIPIRGTAIVSRNESGATIFSGKSGVGKSSISAILCLRGWSILADDICRISVLPEAKSEINLFVHHGYTAIQLTADTCNRLEIDTTVLRPAATERDKFYYTPERIALKQCAPTRIIILNRPASTSRLEWGKCSDEVAIAALEPQMCRIEIGKAILGSEKMIALVKSLISTVPVFVLSIPQDVGPEDVAMEIERAVSDQLLDGLGTR